MDGLSPDLIVLGVDDEIRSRINRLLHRMIDQLEEDLDPEFGAPPAVRYQLLRSALPALLREFRDEKSNEELEVLRVELRDLNASVKRSALGSGVVCDDDDVVELRVDGGG